MIWARYRRLREIALSEFGDVVIGAEVIVSHRGRAKKLRLVLEERFLNDLRGEARSSNYCALSCSKLERSTRPCR